jgi:stearoyl-CoA desaturase (delta-9 desaturase)
MTMIGSELRLGEGRAEAGAGSFDAVDEALRRSESTFRSPRMVEAADTSAIAGSVHWKPVKSLWISTMTVLGLAAPFFFTWGALLVFLATTAVTICLGHSLGMHRRLIHRSYDCPLWLERLFVYFGTLVGMAGPYGMIRQHDIRDWAQRKPVCHPYLAHRSTIARDGYWQLHCELRLANPPTLVTERRVSEDGFYRLLEATWMRVKPIVDMAISRFDAFDRLQRELTAAKNELAARKLIDRAKGILMQTHGISEDEAYGRLRQTAMNEKRKIADIAQSLITAAALLEK